MIPDDVVDEVRLRADLVEVVGESVQLKKSGREWKGKCPFHDDRTPSFYVVPEKGFYKCFGCGESGDIFTYVMKQGGMDFNEAVKHLGGRFGVEVREVKGRDEERDDPLRPHYEVNAFAREFFRGRLADPEGGASPRAYLAERGIDDATAERFGLGFAPDAWREFRDAAAAHEFPEALLLEVGLLTTSERSSEPYDRFRNRIIFPIEDVRGRVVAFGGRILGEAGKGAPKYLNSPESPIYHKGRVLYALGWSRNAIRREEVALVVEGYMDVVALAAGGVENSVATLGTSLTSEHAALLKRYTQRALLLFDSDEAGLRASFRAADELLAHGIHPSVVTLPEGHDPDTLIRKEGAEGLRRELDRAVDVIDRKMQLLDEHGFFESIDRTRTAVDKLLPTIRATQDPALRDIYISKVAERTGVRRRTLEEEVARLPAGSPGYTGGGSFGGGRPGGGRPGGGRPGSAVRGGSPGAVHRLGPERQLLLVLLKARGWIDRALERVGPGEFHDPAYRAIFEALTGNPELEAPPAEMEPEAARRLERLLGDPEELEHTERVFEESIGALVDRAHQRRQDELERALRATGDEVEKRSLLEELGQLRKERRGRWNLARREHPVRDERNDQR